MGSQYAVLDVCHKKLVRHVKLTRHGVPRSGTVVLHPNYSMAAIHAEQLTVKTGRAFLPSEVRQCVKPSPSRSSPSLLSSRSFPPSSGILPASTPAP